MASKDKSKKAGRNRGGCEKYKNSRRDLYNKAASLRKRLKSHPNDLSALDAADRLVKEIPNLKSIFAPMTRDEFLGYYRERAAGRFARRISRVEAQKKHKQRTKSRRKKDKAAEDSGDKKRMFTREDAAFMRRVRSGRIESIIDPTDKAAVSKAAKAAKQKAFEAKAQRKRAEGKVMSSLG